MTHAEFLAAIARVLHDMLLRQDSAIAQFTGQVTVELHYAEGAARAVYVNTREGVRLGR